MKKIVIIPVLLSIFLQIRCTAPADPFENYSNAVFRLLSFTSEESVIYEDDSVHFKLELTMPHLLDYITWSDGSTESIHPCRYQRKHKDTLTISKLFRYAGVFDITFTATRKNDSQIDTTVKVTIASRISDHKDVYWLHSTIRESLFEGETLKVGLEELYSNSKEHDLSFSLSGGGNRVELLADTMITFSAAYRDSGEYIFYAFVESEDEIDSLRFIIEVKPKYHTITLPDATDSGSVTIEPEKESYRLGDSVTVKAVPGDDFVFIRWSEGLTGYDDSVKVMITRNIEIAALFRLKEDATCLVIDGGSINELMKEYAPLEKRPQMICPLPGLYENNSVRIKGNVRIAIK